MHFLAPTSSPFLLSPVMTSRNPGSLPQRSERRPAVRGWFGGDGSTNWGDDREGRATPSWNGGERRGCMCKGGKFSSLCARAWALSLSPPRSRIRAAPGFSVLVLGFQPRLLGNRIVTSRTDVTTVYHRTRYPGPIVDSRIGLRSPSTSGVHSCRDVDFGNRLSRSCRNDNTE